MTLPDLPLVEVTSVDELWAWLGAHHGGGSVLLVTWKAAEAGKYVSREDVLDALAAHGWIDGRRWRHADAGRTIQLIGPRKAEVWAKSYKDRAVRLVSEGRMTAPGRAAWEAARADRRWHDSDPVDALVVPEDLRKALEAAGAGDWFDATAPSYRRNVLRFLASARRAETRARRVAIIADHAGRGKKVPQY